MTFNPLLHIPSLGSSNAAAHKNMMPNIWTNWVQLSDQRIENILGKGEIARYEHFLLFPQCFQKLSFCPKAGFCLRGFTDIAQKFPNDGRVS